MRVYNKFLSAYLFLLAVLIGIELCLGIFAAPAIFFPARALHYETLTHFESGIIMTQVFLKFNKILILISLISLLMEILPFYWRAKKQTLKLILSLIILILASFFVFYFTRNIVELQKLGATMIQTKEFIFNHKLSEQTLKLVIFFQIVLFFIKIKEINYERKY